MGQRVNIQYSVEIEELPVEVTRPLRGALTEFESAQTNTLGEINEKTLMSLDTIAEIDTIRAQLTRIDFVLSDVNNLVNAYLNYSTADTSEPPAPPSFNESPLNHGVDIPADRVGDLQKQIEEFRNNLVMEPPENEVSD